MENGFVESFVDGVFIDVYENLGFRVSFIHKLISELNQQLMNE